MRINPSQINPPGTERASTFVIVLWISVGLVSIALFFGQAMSFELRSSENRVAGIAAEQAIEGAIRYVQNELNQQISYGSNGCFPDPGAYVHEAVSVGQARFWLIGRDTNAVNNTPQMTFGLVDEAAKLNLNSGTSNMFAALVEALPAANQDLPSAILDWRATNSQGTFQTYYPTRPQPYSGKNAQFETVDELRLVYGGDMDTLVGEDANRNGILDPNENDENHDGIIQPGVLEYVTVYSREPNTRTNGDARVNIRSVNATGPVQALLQTAFGQARATQILNNLGAVQSGGGQGGNGRGAPAPTVVITSPLQFYIRGRMTAEEFAKIANDITVVAGPTINGRVNINTASATVLGCLPGFDANPSLAQTIVSYRQTNPDKLGSIAWLVEALGQGNTTALAALVARDCITTQSYQCSADIAALGANGRGYRRTRVVFDTCEGVVKILYRQDLTHLGWALGKEVRQNYLNVKTSS